MSLTSSLLTASSGLLNTQYQIAITNTNVSNAGETGYTRKTYSATSVSSATGSTFTAGQVERTVNTYLSKTVVAKNAELGAARTINDYLASYDTMVGQVDGGTDLSSMIDTLQASISALSASADSESAKSQVLADLEGLTTQINALSAQVQSLRTEAEGDIADTVAAINDGLSLIASLNDQIVSLASNGADVTGLEDQRDAALVELSSLIGISYYTTSDNQVQVYTQSGSLLLGVDGAVTLDYTAAGRLDAAVSYPDTLSGITLNGRDITGTLTSGELGALLSLRDDFLVGEQEKLDALAGALIAQINDAANASSTYPPLNSLTSAGTVAASDSFTATGSIRIAITGTDGTLVSTQDLDLGGITTIADLVTALNGISGVSASVSSDSKLVVAASSASQGIVIAGIDESVGAEGEGFSSYFGFNDILTGTDARSIGLVSAMSDDPSLLPTATLADTLTVGAKALTAADNSGVTRLAEALTGDISFEAAGGFSARTASLADYAASIVSAAATMISTAETTLETAQDSYDYVSNLLTNQTAVNIDEEIARLTLFQNQYEATAQLISITQELFDTLINMVK